MAAKVLRRALLYVPGSSQKMLSKSRSLDVDCVAYDLEDSVTLEEKPKARKQLQDFLNQPRASGIREQAVRINAVSSGMAMDDLLAVAKSPNLDAIVIPKVNSAADLHFVTDVLRHAVPDRHSPASDSQESSSTQSTNHPIRLIALIESARAVTSLSEICTASPYLSGLIFAAEDFALDLSIRRTPSLREFLYARSALVTHARAYNIPSAIDLVCTAYKSETGGQKVLEEECEDGKNLGFNGKQLIHPSQVEAAQRIFGVSEEESVWATRIVIAAEKADKAGRGAWTMDGKMIDAPVIGKAMAILERARLCQVDVEALREEWKGEEPQ